MRLAAVNSINWARIAAQIPYYAYAALALGAPDRPVAFSVPTGNFGNVFAAWAARRMGLPIERLIVGANRNDILARFLAANDMSVRGGGAEPLALHGHPGLLQLRAPAVRAAGPRRRRHRSADAPLPRARAGCRCPTRRGARRRRCSAASPWTTPARSPRSAACKDSAGYLADPHTAIGTAAARALAPEDAAIPVVVAATAHPAKFPDAVERATGARPPLPPALADLYEREERYAVLAPDLAEVEAGVRAHTRRNAAARRRLTCPRRERETPNAMSDAVRVTRLPNGLTVVSETMPRVETVSFGAYVAAGTRDEAAEENGVSHFLEHMAFKGTEKRDAAAIAREIENVGGHLNAYTAREQTAYYCKVLKEDLPLAADIIGDILTHSTFAPEELERERGVILQEIGQANDTPDDIIFDHFQATAFPKQPMGRPTLGTEEVIRAMPREALTGYMRRHYGPERMVVAAAGALEHDRLLDLVQRHFADLPQVVPAAAGARPLRRRRVPRGARPRPGPHRARLPLRRLRRAAALPVHAAEHRCSAAACPRACSRRSGSGAAWSTPSTPSPTRSGTAACSRSTPAPARRRPRSWSPSRSRSCAACSAT